MTLISVNEIFEKKYTSPLKCYKKSKLHLLFRRNIFWKIHGGDQTDITNFET